MYSRSWLWFLIGGILINGARELAADQDRGAASAAVARDPYIGAIIVDAGDGRELFSDNPNTPGYPASVVKLMDLLIVLEKVRRGELRLADKVTITQEAQAMGGSQVDLKAGEVFTVDDLLYAMLVESGNDAAMAVAVHVAGSKKAFVALMNRRARELGMQSTRFASVHGLPPDPGQAHDVSTARDLAILARAVLQLPDTLRFTATRTWPPLHKNAAPMRNHNHLLETVEGCDGLKTGWFRTAGWSLVATARRGDIRIIAVVLGSSDRQMRDLKARELLARGFSLAQEARQAPLAAAASRSPGAKRPWRAAWLMLLLGLAAGACLGYALALWRGPRRQDSERYLSGP
jgi:D-alanyl-D-alanine carboxypeptidase (penicillin-binding protein 5/6)